MIQFRNEIPKTIGYYWYVDTEYPVPVIGYASCGKFHDRMGGDCSKYVGKWLFIGPRIREIECSEVEIVK